MSSLPNNQNNTFKNTPINPNGAILVWDLDLTLVANYFDPSEPESIVDPIINTNALEIMNKAFKSNNFSANLMLTNNGNLQFINLVVVLMTQEYNKMFPDDQVQFLFSIIYTTAVNEDGSYINKLRIRDPTRKESLTDPRYSAKRVEDVRNMCVEGGIPANNLAERVFFFDDLPTHIIRGEITRGHYIQIEPPFNTVQGDMTNYGAVLEFLGNRNLGTVGTVGMRKQSGGRKTKRKNSNVLSKRRRQKQTARRR